MMFMPFNILGIWFRGLLAIAIIAGGIYLLSRWYDESHVTVSAPASPPATVPATDNDPREARPTVAVPAERVFRFDPGMNRETALLAGALALLTWATLGGPVRRGVSTLFGGPRPASGGAADEPSDDRTGETHYIKRPNGTEIRVECYGPPDAPPVVMSHGWGANSTAWYYTKKAFAGRFRLILWDEPGMGLSKKPDDNDFRLETMAADLDAVIGFAGDRRVVLVGHSIGGMIALTYCKTAPERIARTLAGLVLVHTTYTNPVRTTSLAPLYTAIETPVIIPLLHLTIWLWPLVWVMNWLSYINGSAHRSTHKSSFAGTETRGQLDFCARFMPHARPDVLARGMLGMIRYDATDALKSIPVPTLVVVGDQDTTTLPEAGQYISSHVPNGRLVTLAPARHMGLMEQHSQFNKSLVEFTESCRHAGAAL